MYSESPLFGMLWLTRSPGSAVYRCFGVGIRPSLLELKRKALLTQGLSLTCPQGLGNLDDLGCPGFNTAISALVNTPVEFPQPVEG